MGKGSLSKTEDKAGQGHLLGGDQRTAAAHGALRIPGCRDPRLRKDHALLALHLVMGVLVSGGAGVNPDEGGRIIQVRCG